MKPTKRNILAFIAAIIVGSVINSGLIKLGAGILPVPEGVDPNDLDSIRTNAHLYTSKHFILTFLAHAIGTLAGGYTVSRLAVSNYKNLSLGIGGFFMLMGIIMAILLPEFWKYSIVDLLLAYIPMALLGWKIANNPT